MLALSTEAYEHPSEETGQMRHWVLIELQGQSFMYH